MQVLVLWRHLAICTHKCRSANLLNLADHTGEPAKQRIVYGLSVRVSACLCVQKVKNW